MNTPLCMLVSAMLRSRRPILSQRHDSGLLNLCQVATVKVFGQDERDGISSHGGSIADQVSCNAVDLLKLTECRFQERDPTQCR